MFLLITPISIVFHSAIGEGTSGGSSSRQSVADLVSDLENPRIWKTAIEQLKVVDDSSLVPLLVEALGNRRSSLIRDGAEEVLSSRHDSSLVPALLEALKDGNVFRRYKAVKVLGDLRYQSADVKREVVAQLRKVALNDHDRLTKSLAVRSLGKLGDPSVIRDLPPLAKQDDQGVFCGREVPIALGRIGSQARSVEAFYVLMTMANEQGPGSYAARELAGEKY